jgi:monoamine oxidase
MMQSTEGATGFADGAGRLKRIVVVGAGLSGVAAARALQDGVYQVIILEGPDRVGGRCITVDGIDFGAHWIHGTEGNPITNLTQRYKLWRVSFAWAGGLKVRRVARAIRSLHIPTWQASVNKNERTRSKD